MDFLKFLNFNSSIQRYLLASAFRIKPSSKTPLFRRIMEVRIKILNRIIVKYALKFPQILNSDFNFLPVVLANRFSVEIMNIYERCNREKNSLQIPKHKDKQDLNLFLNYFEFFYIYLLTSFF